MNPIHSRNAFGLTDLEARWLRLLFDAASDSRPVPRWVLPSQARLERLGLVHKGRLSMAGLVVAANLRKVRRSWVVMAA